MTIRSINTSGLPQGVLTPMGDLLFAASEPGAWYDPSDLSTLFQDTAGTTPVTAVEQDVALMLDKSGRGNHASQATSTKRPKYSRRVNLLTKTEQFDDAVWVKENATVTLNAAVAPDGTTTADLIVPNGTNGRHSAAHTLVPGMLSVRHTLFVKAGGYSKFAFKETCTTGWFAAFNLSSGAVISSTPGVNPTIESVGSGWFRVGFTSVNAIPAGKQFRAIVLRDSYTSGDPNDAPFTADGTSGIYVWGASLTLATDAHLPYQRVNTATDYDADPAKFPGYLLFDGVDDALATGNIDFTGTDKMTVWAGVTKLADSPLGILAEFGENSGNGHAGFYVAAPSTSGFVEFKSRGSLGAVPIVGGLASAPANAVITGFGQVTPSANTLRVNGGQTPTNTADQGVGSYGSRILNIGSRAGTSLYFNGRLYGLIVRGAQSSLSQIEATELYIRRRMMLP